MTRDDERFMTEALDLAASAGFTSPNPRVGAVFVRDGVVVARGRHQGPGTAHAEAQAMQAGADVSGATLYVNLEPCVHHGHTPPCVSALVAAGIARVVVAGRDPDVRVRGRGLAALRAAGVEVREGVLGDAAARLNAAYAHHRSTGRPLVSLKLAFTLDGRLSAPDGSSRWITGPAARRRVHERRAEVDAVMVGAGTVVVDDPHLSARDVDARRQPARVVVDAVGRVPATARVFAPGARTIVATTAQAPHEAQLAWKEAGAEVELVAAGGGGVDLVALCAHLGADGMLEVLCEGGGALATSLLRAGLVDRLELHLGAAIVGPGGATLGDVGVTTMTGALRWRRLSTEPCDDDVIVVLERVPG